MVASQLWPNNSQFGGFSKLAALASTPVTGGSSPEIDMGPVYWTQSDPTQPNVT